MDYKFDKNNYELLHKIAESDISSVWVARNMLNNRLVCAKLIEMDAFPVDLEELRARVSFWATSDNENQIQYYGSFISGSTLWFLYEYMDGGSLHDILKFAYHNGLGDEVLIASIAEQILLFLQYWHEKHQIHRDIRPETILVSNDGHVKVGAIGSTTSLIMRGQRARARFSNSYNGPAAYAPPEVSLHNGYTEKADIWSFGITVYELATGHHPYSGVDEMNVTKEILSKTPETTFLKAENQSSNYSSKFLEFLKMCLNTNQTKRLSAKELLKSAFIKESKGMKYIATTLMTNMPPLYKRYEVIHKQIKEQPQENPEWTQIAQNFKFSSTMPEVKMQQSKSEQKLSPSKSDCLSMPKSDDSIEICSAEDPANIVHKGRFVVTYSKKGNRKKALKHRSASHSNLDEMSIQSCSNSSCESINEKKIEDLRARADYLEEGYDALSKRISEAQKIVNGIKEKQNAH